MTMKNDKVTGLDTGRRVDLDAADARTLRLSVPVITAEKVEQLVKFQQRLIQELKNSAANDETAVSKAQEAAAAGTGLNSREANELEALARVYAGQAWTLRELERRLEEAKARVAEAEAKGARPDPKESAAVQTLPKEIAWKKAPGVLERRYGEESLALLRARHDELLSLHEELTALLRR